MTAQDPPAYSDRQYFTQLKRQADDALSKTERTASSLVAQVLQVHALLGATVGFLPSESGRRSAQRTLQLGALARTREKIGSLKTEVSAMLQEIVVAEAAIIGLEGAMQLGGGTTLATLPSVSVLLPNTATSPPAVAVSPKVVAMPTFTATPMVTSSGSAVMSVGTGVKETAAGMSEGVGLNVFSITTVPEELDVSAGKERPPAGESSITATRDGVSVVSIAEAPPSLGGPFTPKTSLATPTKKGSQKSRLPAMTCKICTRTFKYRTPLIKHFCQHRETQNQQIDLSNYHLFVDFEDDTDSPLPDTALRPATDPVLPSITAASTSGPPAEAVEGGAETAPPREESLILDSKTSVSIVVSQSPPLDASATDTSYAQYSAALPLFPDAMTEDDGEPPAKRAKESKKAYTCVVCSKSFGKPNKLMRHMSIHDPERPRVVCKLCSRSFIRYQSLFQHVQSQHPAAVEGLQLDAEDITCKYCSRTFTRIESLYDHIQAKHAELKKDIQAEEDGMVTRTRRRRREGGNVAFRCTTCTETFVHLAAYQEHVCHGKAAEPEQVIRCIHCSLSFPSQQHLSSHQASAHQFSCDTCSKTFLHEAYLNVHKVIHSGPGRFTCQECQLSMEELEEYQKHIKTHPKYSPYKCTGCGKAFPFPSLMVMHKCSAQKAALPQVATQDHSPATQVKESPLPVET